MPRLGTSTHPVICRVQTEERQVEMSLLCKEHGFIFLIGLEPDKPEDIAQFDLAVNDKPQATVSAIFGRNEPCPCGSRKKYRRCCIDQQPTLAS